MTEENEVPPQAEGNGITQKARMVAGKVEAKTGDLPVNLARNKPSSHLLTSFIASVVSALLVALSIYVINDLSSEISTLQEWKNITISRTIPQLNAKILSVEKNYSSLSKKLDNMGNELTSLSGRKVIGSAAYYKNTDLGTADKEAKICALSLDYEWGCTRKTVRKYKGKKVYISLKGHDNNSQAFIITGFFTPTDNRRIVQIPKGSLKHFTSGAELQKLINTGVIEVTVTFENQSPNL